MKLGVDLFIPLPLAVMYWLVVSVYRILRGAVRVAFGEW